jgi:hypothetical protein
MEGLYPPINFRQKRCDAEYPAPRARLERRISSRLVAMASEIYYEPIQVIRSVANSGAFNAATHNM